MATSVIDLQRFELGAIKSNRLILCIGRRGSGKSTLLRNLLYSLKDRVNYWIAITPTLDTEREWLDFLPRSMIHRSLDKAMLAELLDWQDAISRRAGGERRTVGLVWDDLMFQRNVLKGEAIRELFFNGRHLNIFWINTAQYCMDTPADLRLNIDYCMTFYDRIPDNREKIRKYFCGTYTRGEFDATFKAATSNYRCMVIDNVQSEVRWFKAEQDLPDFRLGDDVYWRIQNALGRNEEQIMKAKQSRGAGETVTVSLVDP